MTAPEPQLAVRRLRWTITEAADLAGGLDWVAQARCRNADPEQFFPTLRRHLGVLDMRPAAEVAWRYCQHCPVLDGCHQLAARTPGTVGIWAGAWWRLKSTGSSRTVRLPLIPAAPKQEAS